LIRFQSEEHSITGDDQIGFSFDRTFENAIIIRVVLDHIKGETRNDYFCRSGHKLRPVYKAALLSMKVFTEGFSDFGDDCRRKDQPVTAFSGRLPK
jgi:hypothetical protein